MRQTTLSVVLEAEPASTGRLSGIVEKVKHDEEDTVPPVAKYSRLKSGGTSQRAVMEFLVARLASSVPE